jgi:hypothetical protein
VTLVPGFREQGEAGALRAALQEVSADEEPFQVRFGAPIAMPDATRPDYYAVFLTVNSTDADEARPDEKPNDATEVASGDEPAHSPDSGDGANEQPSHLHRLRQRLLEALEPLREDVYPQLLEQEFLPHVTLALGLGEAEAHRLVRDIRAEPLTHTFLVEVIWLVTQTFGEGARFERAPFPLGRVAPVEIMRD